MKKKRFCCHLLIVPVVIAAVTAAVMLLWNCLIPSIVGWASITYWQALGLIVLCRLLLGGIGRHGMFGRGHCHPHHPGHLHEKWEGMSRSERREMIRRHMCGESFAEPGQRSETDSAQ